MGIAAVSSCGAAGDSNTGHSLLHGLQLQSLWRIPTAAAGYHGFGRGAAEDSNAGHSLLWSCLRLLTADLVCMPWVHAERPRTKRTPNGWRRCRWRARHTRSDLSWQGGRGVRSAATVKPCAESSVKCAQAPRPCAGRPLSGQFGGDPSGRVDHSAAHSVRRIRLTATAVVFEGDSICALHKDRLRATVR